MNPSLRADKFALVAPTQVADQAEHRMLAAQAILLHCTGTNPAAGWAPPLHGVTDSSPCSASTTCSGRALQPPTPRAELPSASSSGAASVAIYARAKGGGLMIEKT